MATTDENKAFVKEMLGLKKQLTDYPDRFDPKIRMHEPQMLPFGGDYQGLADFQKFYPEVRAYYDFSTWELPGVTEADLMLRVTQQEYGRSPLSRSRNPRAN